MKNKIPYLILAAAILMSCGGSSKRQKASCENNSCADSCEQSVVTEATTDDFDFNIEADPNDVFVKRYRTAECCNRKFDNKKPVTLKQLNGGWSPVGNPHFCYLAINGDNLLMQEAQPEYTYKISMTGSNTVKISFVSCMEGCDPSEAMESEEEVWFCGDTLCMGANNVMIPYLPFGTISIGGKRVNVDFFDAPDKQAKYLGIINRLCNEPYRDDIFDEWNALIGWIEEGESYKRFSEECVRLYLRHPMGFLSWAEFGDTDEFLELLLIKGTVTIPKKRIEADIQRVPDKVARKQLTKSLEWLYKMKIKL